MAWFREIRITFSDDMYGRAVIVAGRCETDDVKEMARLASGADIADGIVFVQTLDLCGLGPMKARAEFDVALHGSSWIVSDKSGAAFRLSLIPVPSGAKS